MKVIVLFLALFCCTQASARWSYFGSHDGPGVIETKTEAATTIRVPSPHIKNSFSEVLVITPFVPGQTLLISLTTSATALMVVKLVDGSTVRLHPGCGKLRSDVERLYILEMQQDLTSDVREQILATCEKSVRESVRPIVFRKGIVSAFFCIIEAKNGGVRDSSESHGNYENRDNHEHHDSNDNDNGQSLQPPRNVVYKTVSIPPGTRRKTLCPSSPPPQSQKPSPEATTTSGGTKNAEAFSSGTRARLPSGNDQSGEYHPNTRAMHQSAPFCADPARHSLLKEPKALNLPDRSPADIGTTSWPETSRAAMIKPELGPRTFKVPPRFSAGDYVMTKGMPRALLGANRPLRVHAFLPQEEAYVVIDACTDQASLFLPSNLRACTPDEFRPYRSRMEKPPCPPLKVGDVVMVEGFDQEGMVVLGRNEYGVYELKSPLTEEIIYQARSHLRPLHDWELEEERARSSHGTRSDRIDNEINASTSEDQLQSHGGPSNETPSFRPMAPLKNPTPVSHTLPAERPIEGKLKAPSPLNYDPGSMGCVMSKRPSSDSSATNGPFGIYKVFEQEQVYVVIEPTTDEAFVFRGFQLRPCTPIECNIYRILAEATLNPPLKKDDRVMVEGLDEPMAVLERNAYGMYALRPSSGGEPICRARKQLRQVSHPR